MTSAPSDDTYGGHTNVGGGGTAVSLVRMDQSTDTNAAIWKSEEVVQNWTANADEREWKRAALGAAGGDADPLGRYPRRPRQAPAPPPAVRSPQPDT